MHDQKPNTPTQHKQLKPFKFPTIAPPGLRRSRALHRLVHIQERHNADEHLGREEGLAKRDGRFVVTGRGQLVGSLLGIQTPTALEESESPLETNVLGTCTRGRGVEEVPEEDSQRRGIPRQDRPGCI